MVSMFVEARDSFGSQPSAKGEYQVVVAELSLDLTVRNGYDLFKRIDAGNFCFNEINFSIQQRLPQIKRNIVPLTFTKSEPDECGIENKLAAARHECDLMLVTELFGQTLRGYHACESTTQD